MTVAELITYLQGYPQEAPVYIDLDFKSYEITAFEVSGASKYVKLSASSDPELGGGEVEV
jgi:hypothetical protein